jgi:hypothetical protein
MKDFDDIKMHGTTKEKTNQITGVQISWELNKVQINHSYDSHMQ